MATKASVTAQIMRLLSAVPDGLSAPELQRRLRRKLSQPTLWRHLNALRSRGLLTVEGRARATRYRSSARAGSPAVYNHGLYESVAGGISDSELAAHPVQIEGFKRMTPVEKLRMVADLYRMGIQLKVAGLRMTHPDWTEARLLHEARSSLLRAGT